jgi:hypothetical protein
VFAPESFSKIDSSIIPSKKALDIVKQISGKVIASKWNSFNDQIAFPAEIYYLDLLFYKSVIEYNNALVNDRNNRTRISEKGAAMRSILEQLRNTLTKGSGWDRWKNFYLPENFRIHTPPPTLEMIDKLIGSLQ